MRIYLQHLTLYLYIMMLIAQCLYTMSEENEAVAELLRQPANQQILSALLTNDKVLLYTRVILTGKG